MLIRNFWMIQYHIRREEVNVTAADLLNTNVPGGITEEGVRDNCSALLHYCANWIGGLGCVPVNNVRPLSRPLFFTTAYRKARR